MEKKLTVIKVGTSTLTYENGKINYRRIESLCKVIADLQNSGEQIILVSSGQGGAFSSSHRDQEKTGSCGYRSVRAYVYV